MKKFISDILIFLAASAKDYYKMRSYFPAGALDETAQRLAATSAANDVYVYFEKAHVGEKPGPSLLVVSGGKVYEQSVPFSRPCETVEVRREKLTKVIGEKGSVEEAMSDWTTQALSEGAARIYTALFINTQIPSQTIEPASDPVNVPTELHLLMENLLQIMIDSHKTYKRV